MGDDAKQSFGMALKKSPAVQVLDRIREDDWRYYRFIPEAKCMLPLTAAADDSTSVSSSGTFHCCPYLVYGRIFFVLFFLICCTAVCLRLHSSGRVSHSVAF